MLQAEFDRTTGRLTFSDPDLSGVQVRSGMAWARYRLPGGAERNQPLTGLGATILEQEIHDLHGSGGQWTCKCQPNADGLALTYHIKSYPLQPFILLRLELHNLGHSFVNVQNLCLFQASPSNGAAIQLPGLQEDYRFFKVGWLGWSYTGLRMPDDRDRSSWLDNLTQLSYSNPATTSPKGRGEFASEGWGMLCGSSVAMLAGYASTARQFGQVYTSLRPGHEALMLLSQVDGIRLDPGETCESDWGYLQFVPLPNPQPQADFVSTVAREMQARVPPAAPAPMWTHWYQFYHDIDEQRFLDNLDQLAELQPSLPIQVAELDEGYQPAWGDWTTTNQKFPHGLEWLAGEMRRRGFTPGLWLAPFTVQAKSAIARQRPDWLVKDRKGKPSRALFLDFMFFHALDLTHPEVLEHLKELAHSLIHDLGFEMLKLDFLNSAALPGDRYDPKITRAQALRRGLQVVREGAGEQAFLLGCGCPFGPAIGVVDALRIGPDTAPSWTPYFNWLPWAAPLTRSNPSMPALRNAIRNTLVLNSLHQSWWWNDPDCLLVRDSETSLTEAEVQSSVSLVGLSGGMLVSSDDLGKVPQERLKWLISLVPNLGLRGEPLDLLQHEMPGLYRVKLEQAGQEWQLVALFNWSDQTADLRLRPADLGYAAGARLHLFDFWERQYRRVSEAEVVFAAVPAHGCKLLRTAEVGEAAQVVGDTLHISQGKELRNVRIVEGTLEIETIDMGRRVEGEVWLAGERMPIKARCNGADAAVEAKGQGVYAVKVDFTGQGKIVLVL